MNNFIFNSEDVKQKRTEKSLKRAKNPKGARIHIDDDLKLPTDVWSEINALNPMEKERLDFSTQKPEALLERIIKASSNEGDVVADFFCGSGTTPAVAKRLNRQYFACDISDKAIEITRKRINSINFLRGFFNKE